MHIAAYLYYCMCVINRRNCIYSLIIINIHIDMAFFELLFRT